MQAAHARIRRQRIAELSCNRFLDAEDVRKSFPEVKVLTNQQVLFGLSRDADTWTVFTVNYVFSQCFGAFSALQLDQETRTMFAYFSNDRNTFSEFARFEDGRIFWLGSEALCPLLLNVMLMLEKVPHGTKLEA